MAGTADAAGGALRARAAPPTSWRGCWRSGWRGPLGQPVIVENRPGSRCTIGANAVAKAPADGTTLLYGTPGPQIVNPSLMRSLPYDAERDFAPIVSLVTAPNLLVVNPSLPVGSVADLIALAKAKPGGEPYLRSSGIGVFLPPRGGDAEADGRDRHHHVPFRGSGPAIQELIAGRISFLIDTPRCLHRAPGERRAARIAVGTAAEIQPDAGSADHRRDAPRLRFPAAFNYLAAPAGPRRR